MSADPLKTSQTASSPRAHSLLCAAANNSPSPMFQIQDLEVRMEELLQVADLPAAKARLLSLENDAAADGLWEDSNKATALMSQV